MESAGAYFQRLCDKLQRHSESIMIANARHVKDMPGHKAGENGGHRLAGLGIRGMIKPGLPAQARDAADVRVPPGAHGIREAQPGQENTPPKNLVPNGLRPTDVAGDLSLMAASAMPDAFLAGASPGFAARMAGGRTGAGPAILKEAPPGEPHTLVAGEVAMDRKAPEALGHAGLFVRPEIMEAAEPSLGEAPPFQALPGVSEVRPPQSSAGSGTTCQSSRMPRASAPGRACALATTIPPGSGRAAEPPKG
jgi:hypothetical protein